MESEKTTTEREHPMPVDLVSIGAIIDNPAERSVGEKIRTISQGAALVYYYLATTQVRNFMKNGNYNLGLTKEEISRVLEFDGERLTSGSLNNYLSMLRSHNLIADNGALGRNKGQKSKGNPRVYRARVDKTVVELVDNLISAANRTGVGLEDPDGLKRAVRRKFNPEGTLK